MMIHLILLDLLKHNGPLSLKHPASFIAQNILLNSKKTGGIYMHTSKTLINTSPSSHHEPQSLMFSHLMAETC